jgi:hypothetical protein
MKRALMNPTMKRLILLILVVVVLAAIGFAVRYRLKEQAEEEADKKREASYELSRREYAQALEPGMNRKEVEAYIRKKNLPVLPVCCVGGRKSDLIKIGQDEDTWVCGENYVYIALQFDHEAKDRPERFADDDDTLNSITIFHMPGRCL